MKRFSLSMMFFFMTFLSFAFSDIKLYFDSEIAFEIKDDNILDKDGKLSMIIRDGKLYELENNICVGTISEDNGIISISLSQEDVNVFSFDFNKLTGLILKVIYYKDKSVDSSVLFEYEKDKLLKTTSYDENNSLKGTSQYSYDKKTGVRTKISDYNGNAQLISLTEFDNKLGKKIKETEYNEDSSIKNQTLFSIETGNAIERLVYTSNSKNPMKWTFLKFNEEGKYSLGDNFYLDKYLCWYPVLEDYAEKSKDKPIEWNDSYSARIRKYNFTKNTDGYRVIENLKNKRYLSLSSFALCNKNSNFCYCFDTTENDEIDISSCYEIEFIKKKRNYSSMNKSGTGKGPFGFDIGMTYEQIKNACNGTELEHISDDRYYVKPKKSHPLFEKYIVWISDEYGLYYIKAMSHDIYSSDYGTEPKREFEKILTPLEKEYGKFSRIDTVKSDYHFKDDKDFMMSLRDGARTYRAEWYATKDNYQDYDGLIWILLGINVSSFSKAYIWLEYEFLNHDDAKDALNDVL